MTFEDLSTREYMHLCDRLAVQKRECDQDYEKAVEVALQISRQEHIKVYKDMHAKLNAEKHLLEEKVCA